MHQVNMSHTSWYRPRLITPHQPHIQEYDDRGRAVVPPTPPPPPPKPEDKVGDIVVKLNDPKGSTYGYSFSLQRDKRTYRANMFLTTSPTQNCQVSSIGAIESLFNITTKKEECHAVLRFCYSKIFSAMADKLIMMDVRQQFIPHVESCFKVVTKTPYTSTNSSSMCLFLVKME